MAHYVLPNPPVLHDRRDVTARPSLDDLIRPNLRQAFPLPMADQAADDRFDVLLTAIAKRCRGNDYQSG